MITINNIKQTQELLLQFHEACVEKINAEKRIEKIKSFLTHLDKSKNNA